MRVVGFAPNARKGPKIGQNMKGAYTLQQNSEKNCMISIYFDGLITTKSILNNAYYAHKYILNHRGRAPRFGQTLEGVTQIFKMQKGGYPNVTGIKPEIMHPPP